MTKTVLFLSSAILGMAQVKNYTPVTKQMLENPSPGDRLMFSRTYDAQRYSPLDQINKQNVRQLGLAWSRGLPVGAVESIPLVHNGVMYVIARKPANFSGPRPSPMMRRIS